MSRTVIGNEWPKRTVWERKIEDWAAQNAAREVNIGRHNYARNGRNITLIRRQLGVFERLTPSACRLVPRAETPEELKGLRHGGHKSSGVGNPCIEDFALGVDQECNDTDAQDK